MASINLGPGTSGKKAVDADIPLVPFIDLLLCCVMFLLVTAVWNQLASVDAQLSQPGTPDGPTAERIQLQVGLSADGYVLSTSAGDSLRIPNIGRDLDIVGLCSHLDVYRHEYPQQRSITVAADDGIEFERVVATMDAIKQRGFSAITL